MSADLWMCVFFFPPTLNVLIASFLKISGNQTGTVLREANHKSIKLEGLIKLSILFFQQHRFSLWKSHKRTANECHFSSQEKMTPATWQSSSCSGVTAKSIVYKPWKRWADVESEGGITRMAGKPQCWLERNPSVTFS